MEYRELAEENGVKNWRRTPALNTEEEFIEDMADMVIEALDAPALSVSEAAMRNSDVIESYGAAGTGINDMGDSGNPLSNFPYGAEVVNGRFAMMGIVGTTLIELMNGHPILQLVK